MEELQYYLVRADSSEKKLTETGIVVDPNAEETLEELEKHENAKGSKGFSSFSKLFSTSYFKYVFGHESLGKEDDNSTGMSINVERPRIYVMKVDDDFRVAHIDEEETRTVKDNKIHVYTTEEIGRHVPANNKYHKSDHENLVFGNVPADKFVEVHPVLFEMIISLQSMATQLHIEIENQTKQTNSQDVKQISDKLQVIEAIIPEIIKGIVDGKLNYETIDNFLNKNKLNDVQSRFYESYFENRENPLQALISSAPRKYARLKEAYDNKRKPTRTSGIRKFCDTILDIPMEELKEYFRESSGIKISVLKQLLPDLLKNIDSKVNLGENLVSTDKSDSMDLRRSLDSIDFKELALPSDIDTTTDYRMDDNTSVTNGETLSYKKGKYSLVFPDYRVLKDKLKNFIKEYFGVFPERANFNHINKEKKINIGISRNLFDDEEIAKKVIKKYLIGSEKEKNQYIDKLMSEYKKIPKKYYEKSFDFNNFRNFYNSFRENNKDIKTLEIPKKIDFETAFNIFKMLIGEKGCEKYSSIMPYIHDGFVAQFNENVKGNDKNLTFNDVYRKVFKSFIGEVQEETGNILFEKIAFFKQLDKDYTQRAKKYPIVGNAIVKDLLVGKSKSEKDTSIPIITGTEFILDDAGKVKDFAYTYIPLTARYIKEKVTSEEKPKDPFESLSKSNSSNERRKPFSSFRERIKSFFTERKGKDSLHLVKDINSKYARMEREEYFNQKECEKRLINGQYCIFDKDGYCWPVVKESKLDETGEETVKYVFDLKSLKTWKKTKFDEYGLDVNMCDRDGIYFEETENSNVSTGLSIPYKEVIDEDGKKHKISIPQYDITKTYANGRPTGLNFDDKLNPKKIQYYLIASQQRYYDANKAGINIVYADAYKYPIDQSPLGRLSQELLKTYFSIDNMAFDEKNKIDKDKIQQKRYESVLKNIFGIENPETLLSDPKMVENLESFMKLTIQLAQRDGIPVKNILESEYNKAREESLVKRNQSLELVKDSKKAKKYYHNLYHAQNSELARMHKQVEDDLDERG